MIVVTGATGTVGSGMVKGPANTDFAAAVTGDVQAITGRPATSFPGWAAANAAAFR
jgi:hypothetical protein